MSKPRIVFTGEDGREVSPEELTTVDVGSYRIGVEACKLLIAMNNGEKIEPNFHVTVKGKLIVGRSTVGNAVSAKAG